MDRRQQLEMRLEGPTGFCRRAGPRRRATRARWWFEQMRLAVDQATDWEPAAASSDRPAQAPAPDKVPPA